MIKFKDIPYLSTTAAKMIKKCNVDFEVYKKPVEETIFEKIKPYREKKIKRYAWGEWHITALIFRDQSARDLFIYQAREGYVLMIRSIDK